VLSDEVLDTADVDLVSTIVLNAFDTIPASRFSHCIYKRRSGDMTGDRVLGSSPNTLCSRRGACEKRRLPSLRTLSTTTSSVFLPHRMLPTKTTGTRVSGKWSQRSVLRHLAAGLEGKVLRCVLVLDRHVNGRSQPEPVPLADRRNMHEAAGGEWTWASRPESAVIYRRLWFIQGLRGWEMSGTTRRRRQSGSRAVTRPWRRYLTPALQTSAKRVRKRVVRSCIM
jgi:hypothetical protein